jgi:hypothetical protein
MFNATMNGARDEECFLRETTIVFLDMSPRFFCFRLRTRNNIEPTKAICNDDATTFRILK